MAVCLSQIEFLNCFRVIKTESVFTVTLASVGAEESHHSLNNKDKVSGEIWKRH